jgi:hypothetical protein
VPTVLALELTAPTVNLGAITPGVTKMYESSLAATVTSTAGEATLSAADASDGSGKLTNGSNSLPTALQLKAVNAAQPGSAFAGLTGTSNPLVLLRYPTYVAGDQVTISLRQPIADQDPLRAGTYSKRVVFTLSTTTP